LVIKYIIEITGNIKTENYFLRDFFVFIA